jgi:hypothetical protein
MDDCRLQADFFYQNVLSIIDFHAPFELCTFKSNDRPWVTVYFKKLILQRDSAFLNHQHVLYKKLRNKVNRVRKSLQKQYYLDRIDKLKTDNPAAWWRNLKAISTMNNKSDCMHFLTF